MNLQTKKENNRLSLGISKDQHNTFEPLKAFEGKRLEDIRKLFSQ